MRFAPTDDQAAFRDAVRDVLGVQCTPAHVRRWWDAAEVSLVTPLFTEDAPWRALVEMGVLGACAPEAFGGLGLTLVDLIGVCEEAGRCALPEPVVDTAAIAVPVLSELLARDDDALTDVARARLEAVLGEVAQGSVAVVAVVDPAVLVPCADVSALVLVVDGAVHLLDPGAAEAACTAQRSVDGARRVFTLDVGALDLGSDTLVCEGTAAHDVAGRLAAHGAVASSAVLLGLGQVMLDMTVSYVTERRQFGVPVGSFQAVKHQLADAALELQLARPGVAFAAAVVAGAAGAEDPEWGPVADPSVASSMAKAASSDAALAVGAAALQCHGAIGYTVEHDLHLYLKRTWAMARAWGDAATHRRTIAARLGVDASIPDRRPAGDPSS